jgi:hypothetical protein
MPTQTSQSIGFDQIFFMVVPPFVRLVSSLAERGEDTALRVVRQPCGQWGNASMKRPRDALYFGTEPARMLLQRNRKRGSATRRPFA